MRRPLVLIVIAAIAVPQALAQEATEVFIPIGESPGVSGILSVIGTIVSCDQATGIVTVATDKEQHTATLTKETKIFLDRTAARKSGTIGSRSDCQKGRRVEVKYVYEGETRTSRAEWIKIQVR